SYDGFVILHGTDTMSYTATALSFLLENLGKPVILTGSQLPLARSRTDAAQNMVTALIFAASDGVPTVPEVCILFDNVLLRGNRSRKVSSTGFAGFDSPNFRPLAKIGEHITVDKNLVRKLPTEGFFINESLTENVMMLDIFPGISPNMLRSVFSIKELKGVVLRTYGTGNTPTDTSFLREIENAITGNNLAVVNITQCIHGQVEMGMYDASLGLLRLGVISGVDMTPEAALVKMMFLLGRGYDIDTVKDQMQKDICGEQSFNVFNLLFERGQTKSACATLKAQMLPAGFEKERASTASIRFDGIRTVDSGEYLEFAVFMNYPSAGAQTSTDIAQCLGVVKKQYSGYKTDCTLRCTEKVRKTISDEARPIQITIVSRSGELAWDNVAISIHTDATV
ncbi:MAG: asparaginase domain-containing protein, partial [Oscillospiraceae bacterium]|nr:asparaginase domain-containing protein [Oscillospiraceae bacterium]